MMVLSMSVPLDVFYCVLLFFFFKQKTAYEMRISDWSSDVCSSDLGRREVDVRCDRLRLARPKARRIANQERHLQRFLVDEPLVEPAMLAEKEALIRGVEIGRA